MGCNPSKTSQVATGNTVSTHKLEKKQSNDLEIKQPNVSEETKIEEIADPVPDSGKETDNLGKNVEEKDVEVNATNEEVKGEGIVKSVEFLSETAEGPEIEEVDTEVEVEVEVEAGGVVEVETDVPIGEEEEKLEEEIGEPSNVNDSVDLKETILVEDLNEPEKQNEGEGAE